MPNAARRSCRVIASVISWPGQSVKPIAQNCAPAWVEHVPIVTSSASLATTSPIGSSAVFNPLREPSKGLSGDMSTAPSSSRWFGATAISRKFLPTASPRVLEPFLNLRSSRLQSLRHLSDNDHSTQRYRKYIDTHANTRQYNRATASSLSRSLSLSLSYSYRIEA